MFSFYSRIKISGLDGTVSELSSGEKNIKKYNLEERLQGEETEPIARIEMFLSETRWTIRFTGRERF